VSGLIQSHEQAFDVLVIGGGINGVAIARECAQWSKRTLLVEQNDFSSGTTSRSTRIIHGGLRYLEHAEIGLVRESLRGLERDRLEIRPGQSNQLRFMNRVAPDFILGQLSKPVDRMLRQP